MFSSSIHIVIDRSHSFLLILVYNSMSFTAFTLLCNHHLYVVPREISLSEKKTSCLLNNHSLSFPSPTPGNYQSELTCSEHFIEMESYHMWPFVCLISLSIMFSSFICIAVCIRTSFSYGWLIFHCMSMTHFTYLLIGIYVHLWLLWICYYEHACTSVCLSTCFEFCWIYT